MKFYGIINNETHSTREVNKVFYNITETMLFLFELNSKHFKNKYGYYEFEFKLSDEELSHYRELAQLSKLKYTMIMNPKNEKYPRLH